MMASDLKFSIGEEDLNKVLVRDRSVTGAGFFTRISDWPDALALPENSPERWGQGFGATIDGEDGGFMLFMRDRKPIAIEGFVYGNSWPETVRNISFYKI